MKLSTPFYFLGILLCLSACTNDDNLKDDLIGTAEVGQIDQNAASCDEIDFGSWQDSKYNLPYHPGESRQIGLSSCSGEIHSVGTPDQFAVDFEMEIGDFVLAARGGRVLYIEESGVDGSYPNNKIIIRHTDGTFGQYMHLTFNGAVVEEGQTVSQGDLIGYSGSTGFASDPHLHFVVSTPLKWTFPYFSIPLTFKNTIANERGLLEGRFYPAYEPE
jgi:murein DD-endopeptidase MepM/ murein hydrolase activator NlpD